MKRSENKVWVTMAHVRAGGGCAMGIKAWFKHYDLDFKSFIKNGGIDAETLLKTNDALAIRIIEIAKKDNHYGR